MNPIPSSKKKQLAAQEEAPGKTAANLAKAAKDDDLDDPVEDGLDEPGENELTPGMQVNIRSKKVKKIRKMMSRKLKGKKIRGKKLRRGKKGRRAPDGEREKANGDSWEGSNEPEPKVEEPVAKKRKVTKSTDKPASSWEDAGIAKADPTPKAKAKAKAKASCKAKAKAKASPKTKASAKAKPKASGKAKAKAKGSPKATDDLGVEDDGVGLGEGDKSNRIPLNDRRQRHLWTGESKNQWIYEVLPDQFYGCKNCRFLYHGCKSCTKAKFRGIRAQTFAVEDENYQWALSQLHETSEVNDGDEPPHDDEAAAGKASAPVPKRKAVKKTRKSNKSKD